jgi:hypothetical protein
LERAIEDAGRLIYRGRTAASSPSAARTNEESRSLDRIVVSQQEGVEVWLREHAPAAAVEMSLAAERIAEAIGGVGDRQGGLLAQGLGSLRRALRSLADAVSPAHPEGAKDRFGKECPTDEAKYLSRLHLALAASRDANGLFEYDKSELDLFHQRLTRLNSRLASGVHGSADHEEAEQLYSDVWRVISIYRRCGDRS